MGDIFIAPVQTRQAPWRCLAAPGQVSRGTASPTGILPVGDAAAPGPMAVTMGPEPSDDFRMLSDAARNRPDPNFT